MPKTKFATCEICGRIFVADLKCFACAAKNN